MSNQTTYSFEPITKDNNELLQRAEVSCKSVIINLRILLLTVLITDCFGAADATFHKLLKPNGNKISRKYNFKACHNL